MRKLQIRPAFLALALTCALAPLAYGQSAEKRPMTFLDVQHMRNVGSATPSPDGRWMLYTTSTMDWKEARRQTDIHIVSFAEGLSSTKQLTYTTAKNEGSLGWMKDSQSFLFLSNREAPENASGRNQLYLMRPDGGEARRITDAGEGVADYAVSNDGAWIVYRSGKSGEQQLYRLSAKELDRPAEQLTKHATGIASWRWAPDDKRIYFTSPNEADADEKARREKRFTVNIQNMETPIASLWALDVDDKQTRRLTEGDSYSVGNFQIADDKLAGREYFFDHFTAPDAHFFWCCRRATQLGVDISGFPNVTVHFKRMQERPSVKKLLAYEKEVNEGFAKTA